MRRPRFISELALVVIALATSRLSVAEELALTEADAAAAAAPAEEKGAPLPFHTIEGYGGGAFTPMAYLVNPGGKDRVFGEPAAALSYVNMGDKNLDALSVSETIADRFELSYAADRFGLGSLPTAIHDFSHGALDIGHSDVWLHNFNIRAQAIKENDEIFGGIEVPAVTFGVHLKYNETIADANSRLGGALSSIGYRHASGVDYTVTLTKTLPKAALGRPLILTGGVRASAAADLGILGFGDTYYATFEGSVITLPTDWLLLAYEFRQKTDPYSTLDGLIGSEGNWHGIDAALILNKHSTLVAGYGFFGQLANTECDSAWWLQYKYEF